VNVARFSLEKIESNLKLLGSWTPFKIQSFFCRIGDAGWDENEIRNYLDRLRRIRDSGARILEVQLYTLARRPADSKVEAVSGEFLSSLRVQIAALGLEAEVYGGAD
jgi:hypothetical protein